MEYIVYKMSFSSAVHFGEGSLEDHESTFFADTLFSALCIESLRFGMDTFQKLRTYVSDGVLLLSDGFPYIGERYYLPKPMLRIEREKNGDSKLKKQFKKLIYVPMDDLEDYLSGSLDVERANDELESLGMAETKISAAVGTLETTPYPVGVYRFQEGNGLYIIAGYEEDEQRELLEQLLDALSFSGLGGKRYSGLGRFCFFTGKIPDKIRRRLTEKGKRFMTLSISLPDEGEIDSVLEGASFQMVKRSGFVASKDYADEYQRKRDFFAFAAGACVQKTYRGKIYDVSGGGRHEVLRYAKPMFLEVSR